jgi:NADH:ubiquinone oxidoreductase subunit 3 (subunit A)
MDVTQVVPGSVLGKRIRLGGIALILAGVMLAPQGLLTSDVPSAPEQNLEFATGANSFNYRFGVMLVGVSLSFLVLGVFALYLRLSTTKRERLALAGLIMTAGFIVLFLPVTGFAFYVVPAIGELVEQGSAEMVEVMDQTFLEPFIAIPFLAGILWNVGNILLGIAVWRSEVLWKWGGLLLIVWGISGIPAFLDVKTFQIISTLLGGLALIAVGVNLRRSVPIDTQAGQELAPGP